MRSTIDPKMSKEELKRRDKAATVIQTGVRRWLIKRRSRKPIWSRSLMQSTVLTEVKIKRYQDEIDLWQQRHKVPPMSTSEQQELFQKAQFQFARFSQGLNRRRIQSHRTMAKLAQNEALIDIMTSAPSLDDYDRKSHWSNFHSLPLPIATKARLQHKDCMQKVDMPRWRRIIQNQDEIHFQIQ